MNLTEYRSRRKNKIGFKECDTSMGQMNADRKVFIAKRKKSRFVAVQALYQWLISATPVNELLTHARLDNKGNTSIDWPFFDILVRGVIDEVCMLDQMYSPHLDRPLEQISPIEKTVIRLGAYEMIHCVDVPSVVIINEYVNLAKSFGATDSYKYVNSILHAVACEQRAFEHQ